VPHGVHLRDGRRTPAKLEAAPCERTLVAIVKGKVTAPGVDVPSARSSFVTLAAADRDAGATVKDAAPSRHSQNVAEELK
jgi:hypothetical protein